MGDGLNRFGGCRVGLIRLACLALLVGLWLSPFQVVNAQEIPTGFRLIAEQMGVALYRKDYSGGAPDYVQIVDLVAGASIDLLYGDPVAMDNSHNQGMFGGPNPSFRQKTIHAYWEAYSSDQKNAFCVSNGQFFYMPESPTPLALPLLVDHQLLAEGFGYPQYPEKQLILALWFDHADILPLTPENLSMTDAEKVIGGLTEEANKKPKNAVGRTFVGIWDRDGDQRYETVAIYTTQTATQAEAARTVRSFGATKVMMLDGGGSTQLICQGQTYIDTTRAIPQALGVSAGSQVRSAPSSRPPALSESSQSLGEEPPAAVDSPNIESPALQPTGQDPISNSVDAPIPAATQMISFTEDAATNPPIQAIATSMPTISPFSLDLMQSPEISVGFSAEKEHSADPEPARVFPVNSQNSQTLQTNGMDVLLLPAIISPLSVILIVVARRQIFLLYRDG